MLALAAFVVFVLALFEVTIGSISLVTLGLALLALHFVFDFAVPFGRRNT